MERLLPGRGRTMISKDMKDWIDNASYRQLLSKWRFAPAGSPWFQRETAEYYNLVMAKRRSMITAAEHVQTSKDIGW